MHVMGGGFAVDPPPSESRASRGLERFWVGGGGGLASISIPYVFSLYTLYFKKIFFYRKHLPPSTLDL